MIGPRHRRRLTLSVATVIVAVTLITSTGCAGAVDVAPAPQADTLACATLMDALPTTLAGLSRRGTNDTPGVAAWGDPAVVLRCGTETPGPTTQGCLTVDDVDWVVLGTDEQAPDSVAALFSAYGRTPGVEVELPAGYVAAEVLPGVASAVGALPQSRRCP